MGRGSICYCDNCQRKFRAKTGQAIPPRANWDDPVYRQWIMWNYARRTELWEFNNRVTQAAGGADCIWSGMNSGSVTTQANSFRDLKEICSRAHIIMLDHQRRDDATGFQQNGDTGKRVHSMLGWDKLAPESMAMYENGRTSYRVASKPAAEARMWMIAGMAGGIQPWWHHVGAYHDDRRMYRTAEPVMKWHKANEAYLVESQAGGQRGTGLVAAEYGFLRPRERGRTGGCSLRRLRAGADPGAHSLPAGARRRYRSRVGGTIGAGAGQCRRALRCASARRFAGSWRAAAR